MTEASSYWSELCDLVSGGAYWVRIGFREGELAFENPWGLLLIIPVESCLEASGGPVPIRDVDWVQVSTLRSKGGIWGRARELIDVKDEITEHLRGTQLIWELRMASWATPLFDEESVEVFHFVNPFTEPPEI